MRPWGIRAVRPIYPIAPGAHRLVRLSGDALETWAG